MPFVDRHVLGRAVHLAGGRVNELPDTTVPRRLAQVQRAFDIGIHKAVGSAIRIRDWDERGEVKDDGDVSRQAETKMGIPDVAGHYFDLGKGRYVL